MYFWKEEQLVVFIVGVLMVVVVSFTSVWILKRRMAINAIQNGKLRSLLQN